MVGNAGICSSFVITYSLLASSADVQVVLVSLVAPENEELCWFQAHMVHITSTSMVPYRDNKTLMKHPCSRIYPLDSCNMGTFLAPFVDAWGSLRSCYRLTCHRVPCSCLHSSVLCHGTWVSKKDLVSVWSTMCGAVRNSVECVLSYVMV